MRCWEAETLMEELRVAAQEGCGGCGNGQERVSRLRTDMATRVECQIVCGLAGEECALLT